MCKERSSVLDITLIVDLYLLVYYYTVTLIFVSSILNLESKYFFRRVCRVCPVFLF